MMDTLESAYESVNPYLPYVLGGGAVFIVGVIAYKKLLGGPLGKRGPGSIKAPPNTAVIYSMKRGPYSPSFSPFPVKLETYCRINKIPYLVDSTGRSSSKGKIPWMTYNGETVEDSQFCIEYFNKKLNLDINKHLSPEQRAVSRFIQVLCDEHLYWIMVLRRWVYEKDFHMKEFGKLLGVPAFILKVVSKKITDQVYSQGLGRHTQEEVYSIMMDDLQCLSDYLGTSPFMLGDRLTEADCSAFGILCQFLWIPIKPKDDVMKNLLLDKFPNLYHYCHRIKTELWPDWEECLKN